jgi:hypothetical protein
MLPQPQPDAEQAQRRRLPNEFADEVNRIQTESNVVFLLFAAYLITIACCLVASGSIADSGLVAHQRCGAGNRSARASHRFRQERTQRSCTLTTS